MNQFRNPRIRMSQKKHLFVGYQSTVVTRNNIALKVKSPSKSAQS